MRTLKIYLTAVVLIATTTLIANIPPCPDSETPVALTEDCSFMSSSYEEAEINDIPFNTNMIVMNKAEVEDCSWLLSIYQEEVNDITFDTEKVITNDINNEDAWKLGFVLEEEKEIDDIPFNTKRIFKKYLRNKARF